MRVIATAGHVDHGKSTLVHALTDMEPDRWKEEHRRGLTIDLGFAWTTLPSGETVAFVDVPGHERFVTNMLAGVGPVPAVMFVVAADEGWMPQSAEHLAAIDALGVRHGLLVVTRSDLADPRRARTRALGEIEDTSLGEVEAVTVSGATGQGVDELRGALDRLVAQLPAPDPEGPVRLWVDRAFTIRGAGTVVTGTLPAGKLRTGDELVLAPAGRRVAVEGLQTLGRDADSASAVARAAVNIRGLDRGHAGRGMALITPDRWFTTDTLDVRLRGDPADRLPSELTLHMGAARVLARVRSLGPDTARLKLAIPLPLHVGDVALLRNPGARRIAAGVVVLDVDPPHLGRRGAASARARTLAGMSDHADGYAELRRRGLVRRRHLLAMGCTPPDAPGAGEWLCDPDLWASLRTRLRDLVDVYAKSHPLDPRLPLEAARRTLGLPDRRLAEVLAVEAQDLSVRDGGLVSGEAAPALPPEVEAGLEAIRRGLANAPFAAPEAGWLADLGLTPKLLAAAVRAGRLLRVAQGVYLLPDALERATAVLVDLPEPFTVSEARTALGTSRRVAVPLLELLDSRGVTERIDDSGRRSLRGRAPDR
ncbi:MAG: selenocysteine-specific translation elongation factor [Streptosporangiaceae bacterium]